MKQPLQLYISQQIRNSEYRRKNNRRVSSILTEIRIQSTVNHQQQPSDRLKQLDIIRSEFKKNGKGSKKKLKRSSIQVHRNLIQQKKNKPEGEIVSRFCQKFRVRKKNKPNKVSRLNQFKMVRQSSLMTKRASQQSENEAVQKQYNKNNKSSFVEQLRKSIQFHPDSVDLQSQNYHKLNSFIRGAYDQNEFSSVVNLSQLDRFRRQFYVFDKLYNQIAETNLSNKMTLKDVHNQNFKDVVFINQQKDHATAPQFRTALKKLKIIR